jgi:hypothetical protein
MPGVSGVTVVTNARVYYTTRAAAGASGARHSLRPLIAEGGNFKAKLGCIAPRECGIVSHSSLPATNAKRLRKRARKGALATKQSIVSFFAARWIA